MKICTINVNSIRIRKDLIVDWLGHREKDIDILCVQELKSVDEDFPYRDFEQAGYRCEVFGQKTYNGVAICSRLPLKGVRKGFGDPAWDEQSRLVAVKTKDIILFNIYAPHGGFRGEEKFNYKMKWYGKLMAFLDSSYSPKDPMLMVGDFNVAREDKDVYEPELLQDTIGTMPEEREVFQKLLDWGFTDVFRHFFPDRVQYTWWDYIGGAIWKNKGMRIDYVLCTEPLLNSVTDMEVDLWPRRRRSPKPSDHAPVVVTLDLPGARS
jgi:exodeoxyribonuclease-3